MAAFKAHLPGLKVRVPDVLDGAFPGHVNGLGNGAADERLRRGHHLQMRQVMDAAPAAVRFEGAVEHRQMLRFQTAANCHAVFFHVFDGVEFFNVGGDGLDFLCGISQPLQGLRDSAVDNF